MSRFLAPTLLLAAGLAAGFVPRAAGEKDEGPTFTHSETRSDVLRRGEVTAKVKSKSTFVVPMTLTAEEMGDLDGSWGMGPFSLEGGGYSYVVGPYYGEYGGFGLGNARLGDENCDWLPGRTKAKWTFADPYSYYPSPQVTMTAKWSASSLRVVVAAKRPVFSYGYYFEEGEQSIPADVVLGFGDLDGDGASMHWRFTGDLGGSASYRTVNDYYYLWKVRLSASLAGEVYVPYEYEYDPYGGGY